MPELLFVLLVVVTQPSTSYLDLMFSHMIWKDGVGTIDPEIVDEWSTNIQSGDTSFSGTAHHKAILFYSKVALNRYLEQNQAHNAILVDVKAGKQFIIVQEKITKIVSREEEVFDHYDWKTMNGNNMEKKEN